MSSKIISKSAKSSKPSAPAKSAKKGQKGFTIRISGNSKGRPKGSRNRATLIAQEMLGGEIEDIIRQLIKAAKGGDIQASKFIVGRILPPTRSAPIEISLPSIESPGDIVDAHSIIWSAVGAGDITLDEAQSLTDFLEAKRKAIETTELTAEIERVKEYIRLNK